MKFLILVIVFGIFLTNHVYAQVEIIPHLTGTLTIIPYPTVIQKGQGATIGLLGDPHEAGIDQNDYTVVWWCKPPHGEWQAFKELNDNLDFYTYPNSPLGNYSFQVRLTDLYGQVLKSNIASIQVVNQSVPISSQPTIDNPNQTQIQTQLDSEQIVELQKIKMNQDFQLQENFLATQSDIEIIGTVVGSIAGFIGFVCYLSNRPPRLKPNSYLDRPVSTRRYRDSDDREVIEERVVDTPEPHKLVNEMLENPTTSPIVLDEIVKRPHYVEEIKRKDYQKRRGHFCLKDGKPMRNADGEITHCELCCKTFRNYPQYDEHFQTDHKGGNYGA